MSCPKTSNEALRDKTRTLPDSSLNSDPLTCTSASSSNTSGNAFVEKTQILQHSGVDPDPSTVSPSGAIVEVEKINKNPGSPSKEASGNYEDRLPFPIVYSYPTSLPSHWYVCNEALQARGLPYQESMRRSVSDPNLLQNTETHFPQIAQQSVIPFRNHMLNEDYLGRHFYYPQLPVSPFWMPSWWYDSNEAFLFRLQMQEITLHGSGLRQLHPPMNMSVSSPNISNDALNTLYARGTNRTLPPSDLNLDSQTYTSGSSPNTSSNTFVNKTKTLQCRELYLNSLSVSTPETTVVSAEKQKNNPRLPSTLRSRCNSADSKRSTLNSTKNILQQKVEPSSDIRSEEVDGTDGIQDPVVTRSIIRSADETKIATTEDGPSQLHCEICNKTFARQKLLNRHKKCHLAEKKYICTYCTKGFNDAFDLKRHIRTHTGIRPYKCSLCTKSFTQRCLLETHYLTDHGVHHQYCFKERRSKVYVCEECGHSTSDPEAYYFHLKEKHPKSKALEKFYDRRYFKFTDPNFVVKLMEERL